MSRIICLAVVAALGSLVGCAQCDTCDDFPAPCIGPNCVPNSYAAPGYVPPMMGPNGPGPETLQASPPVDSAPGGPMDPSAGQPAMPSPATPPVGVGEPSPPAPMAPGAR